MAANRRFKTKAQFDAGLMLPAGAGAGLIPVSDASGNMTWTSVRLDQLAAPTADVPWGSKKITGLADPTLMQDAATRNYVDLRRLDQLVAPTGNVNFGGQRQVSVADPVSPADGATKNYVDTGIVQRVNSFPASPVGGQTVDIATVAMGVARIIWRCVYDATNSVWTVIGGAPLVTVDDTSFATASTTYVESGPNVDLPFPGVYDVTVEGHLITPAVATGATFLSPQFGTGTGSIAATDPPAAYQNTQANVAGGATVNKTTRFQLAAGVQLAVKSMMRCSGGSGSSIRRRIWVRPVWLTNP